MLNNGPIFNFPGINDIESLIVIAAMLLIHGCMRVKCYKIPIGINVFVLHAMADDLPLGKIFRGVVPFLLADLARLLLLVFVPALSLWLPMTLGWL